MHISTHFNSRNTEHLPLYRQFQCYATQDYDLYKGCIIARTILKYSTLDRFRPKPICSSVNVPKFHIFWVTCTFVLVPLKSGFLHTNCQSTHQASSNECEHCHHRKSYPLVPPIPICRLNKFAVMIIDDVHMNMGYCILQCGASYLQNRATISLTRKNRFLCSPQCCDRNNISGKRLPYSASACGYLSIIYS